MLKSLKLRYIVASGWALLTLSFLYGQANLTVFYSNSDKFVNMWLSSGGEYLLDDFAIDEQGQLQLNRPIPKRFQGRIEQLLVFDENHKLLFETNPQDSLRVYVRKKWLNHDRFEEFSIESEDLNYFVGVKHYEKTDNLPRLVFVTIKEHHAIDPVFFNEVDQNFVYIKVIFALHILLIIPLMWWFSNWSLKPIDKINNQLLALKQDEIDRLDNSTVKELKPLVESLNGLIHYERQQKEKQRQLLSDLSHGLKTPLSVLQGVARSHSLGIPLHDNKKIDHVINQEVKNMVDQIQHRLKVASNDHSSVLSAQSHQVSEIVDQLVFGMKKIHATKNVTFKMCVPADVVFVGQRNDLMEVVGNLLDNACKYGGGEVHVSAYIKNSKCLYVVVEDNGEGVPDALKEKLGNRGMRLDSRVQGYGLGINIAQELLSSYHGLLKIEDSSLGGAKFTAVFEVQEDLQLR
ncbi:ATP-binding protein [Vibrio fortis]|uniref:ATP-binding protein n=1 Tax=Vibrio fortis TaxID=212667 RepID=UPI0040682E66